MEMIAAKL